MAAEQSKIARTALEPWQQPRPFPGVRAVRIALRTAHLLAFGALYGGHIYDVAPQRLSAALWATVATGAALMAVEMYRSPLWLMQVRGLAAMAKIVIVAAVAVNWELRVALLSAAVIIGGISSHMPGRLRYYSIAHGRVVGSQEAG
ncbi:MAG: hypothetical protein HY699_07225 [Deltaproteobacteria bacterium]|nr:hypothetical protein [Deltaproteobacteria bacterium]